MLPIGRSSRCAGGPVTPSPANRAVWLLPRSSPHAFIVMPYGKKKDPRANRFLDGDAAFHRVYRPLLEDFDIDWVRADLQTDSGIIHTAMLSDLANSDLVIVDLSALSFNVAYELGIRHVFASRSTV